MSNRLKIARLHPGAVLPTRGSALAAGLDLYACEPVTVGPGERVGVRTGIAVAIPVGHYGRVAPRSGLASRHGIDTLAGVVDADYRGEVVCWLINHGTESFAIAQGDRIAQLVIEVVITPEPEWAENLEETARGVAGFGSTGR
jgi:deoxyuridine 5'-triphosphate nucleotidohydrolase